MDMNIKNLIITKNKKDEHLEPLRELTQEDFKDNLILVIYSTQEMFTARVQLVKIEGDKQEILTDEMVISDSNYYDYDFPVEKLKKGTYKFIVIQSGKAISIKFTVVGKSIIPFILFPLIGLIGILSCLLVFAPDTVTDVIEDTANKIRQVEGMVEDGGLDRNSGFDYEEQMRKDAAMQVRNVIGVSGIYDENANNFMISLENPKYVFFRADMSVDEAKEILGDLVVSDTDEYGNYLGEGIISLVNKNNLQITINNIQTKEEYYVSPLLKPNQHLTEVSLNKAFPDNLDSACVYFHWFNENDEEIGVTTTTISIYNE